MESPAQDRYYNASHGGKGKAAKAFAELMLSSAAGYHGAPKPDAFLSQMNKMVEFGIGNAREYHKQAVIAYPAGDGDDSDSDSSDREGEAPKRPVYTYFKLIIKRDTETKRGQLVSFPTVFQRTGGPWPRLLG